MKDFLFFLTLYTLTICAAGAQDEHELAETPPICIVALSQGPAEIQHPGGEWHPAFWLTLVHAEDHLRTSNGGKVVLTYFHDQHREVLEPGSEVEVGFRTVKRVSAQGAVRREAPRDRSVTEIPIPYLLTRPLIEKEFEDAREVDAFAREEIFLSSYVKAWVFPPVFVWSNTGASKYKLQLFNEWDEFIYEAETSEARFKYPYRANFRLAKNSLYKWQVTDEADRIVVRRYPFILLTSLHAEELSRVEDRFESLARQDKATQADYTDLFLLYVQRKLIDKYLHLLQEMARVDHQNPLIHRGLVRAYLAKGAPAHVWRSLQTERGYGGVDELKK